MRPPAREPEVGAALEERLVREERTRHLASRVALAGAIPVGALTVLLLACGLLPRAAARWCHPRIDACLAGARRLDTARAYEECLRYELLLTLLGRLPLEGREARQEAAEAEWDVGSELALAPGTLLPRAENSTAAAAHLRRGAALGAERAAALPRLLLELGREPDLAAGLPAPLQGIPDAIEGVVLARLRLGDLVGADRLVAEVGGSAARWNRERHELLACLGGAAPPAAAEASVRAACASRQGGLDAALGALAGETSSRAAFLSVELALRAGNVARARDAVPRVASAGDAALATLAAAEVQVASGDAEPLRRLFAPRSLEAPPPPALYSPPIVPEALADPSLYPPIDPALLSPVLDALERLAAEPSPPVGPVGLAGPARSAGLPLASDAGLREIAGILALRLAVAEARVGDLAGAGAAVDRAGRLLPASPYPAQLRGVLLLLHGDDAAAGDAIAQAIAAATAANAPDPAFLPGLHELSAFLAIETGDPAAAARESAEAVAGFVALGGDDLASAAGARTLAQLAGFALRAQLGDQAGERPGGWPGEWIDRALALAGRGERVEAQVELVDDLPRGASPPFLRIERDALRLLLPKTQDGARDASLALARAMEEARPFRARILDALARAGDARRRGDAGAAATWQRAAERLARAYREAPRDRAALDLLTF